MSFFKRFGYLLLIAFFMGIGLVFLFSDTLIFREGYFSVYSLERLQYLQVDEQKLLLCVMRSRIQLILFLIFAGMVAVSVWVSYLFSMWYGASMGILAGIFVERFGVKGIILFLACILPQILLYLPGFYGILWICCNRRAYEKTRFVMKMIPCIGVTIIGMFLESYVNPTVLTKIVTFLKFL